jgi:hypothetical protein
MMEETAKRKNDRNRSIERVGKGKIERGRTYVFVYPNNLASGGDGEREERERER